MTCGEAARETGEGQLFPRHAPSFGGDFCDVPLHFDMADMVRVDAAAHRKPAVVARGGL